MLRKIQGKNSGITLIALVITVVVLLILAGISISMLTGQNGILEQATNAKNKTEIATIREEVELSMLHYIMKDSVKKESLKNHFVEDLSLDETKIMDYESAEAIAFWYKNYLFVVDKNDMKIECMAGGIVIDREYATLYNDLLEDGKYVLEVKKALGYGNRFWREEVYINNLSTVIMNNNIEALGTPQAFGSCVSIEKVYLSENLKVLTSGSFNNCKKLKNIALPEGLTKIEQSAFVNCVELQIVNLPDSLEQIQMAAFRYCKKLENISIPEGITVLPREIFNYDSALTSVSLPESLTQISDSAFQFCNNLETIYLPKNIKIIESNAFNEMGLKKVYYGGTEEEFEEIEIDNSTTPNNRYLLDATRYYYKEDKPQDSGNYWHWVNGQIEEWQ